MQEEKSTENAQSVANERSERGKKMIVPDYSKKEKPQKVEKEIPESVITAIMGMAAPKHYRMWLLHKEGASKRRIAELLTNNNNQGQVGNAIKMYIDNPGKQKEVEAKLSAK